MTDSVLLAGTAKREITFRQEGVTVRDPLWAKALVLQSANTCAVILTLDALAIGGIGDIQDEFLPALRKRLERELGIPAGNVLVNASHTHPPGRILCDPDELLNRVFQAVQQAASDMVPVTAGSASRREERISMNRNLTLRNGKHWTIRHSHPGPPEDQVVGVGPLDPEIVVLRLDRLDGRPLAVLYNFACHLLFAYPDGAISANLPGIASSVLEEHLGPGTMAFFLQGAAGDVIDVAFKDLSRPREIRPLGLQLGLSTLSAARNIRTGPASLCIHSETIQLPRRTDSNDRISALKDQREKLLQSLRFNTLDFKSFLPLYLNHRLNPAHPGAPSYAYLQAHYPGDAGPGATDLYVHARIEEYLHGLTMMEELSKIQDEIATFERHRDINKEAGEPTVSAEVLGVKLGDCVLITAPIELLTEIGLNLKAASPYEHTFVAGFTNGYLHYGPPASYYDRGSYEVTECLLAPEWQAIYEQKALEIMDRLNH